MIIEEYHGQGKINDNEMKAFNKEVVNKIYTFLKFIFGPKTKEQEEFNRMTSMLYPEHWDTPELDKETLEGIDIALGKKSRSLR